MIRRPPRSTQSRSSAASDVYKRQVSTQSTGWVPDATIGSGPLPRRNAIGDAVMIVRAFRKEAHVPPYWGTRSCIGNLAVRRRRPWISKNSRSACAALFNRRRLTQPVQAISA
eukprot:TRINITY_DN2111_c0_g1_i1.p1 TRINITY_DN2111_c0_g1~~TRINITY_DN2111_c0_g1_i1.p1  ORF type:complete len:113 (+),score=18.11 TRINITY_DN2111_c0_g1_i1:105-443(+)